ncbi:MAG: hypothetical protein NC086_08755 [Alistipes sp.]|nr:hypothetical protein [Alistipes sp.]
MGKKNCEKVEMDMMKEELKKIVRPGMIGILLVMGFIYYTMFMEFYIRYFPNGPQAEGIFDVSAGLVGQYGASLSENEIEEVKKGLLELYGEADRYIGEFSLSREHGLKSYEDYIDFKEKCYEEVQQSDGTADQNENYRDMKLIENYLTGDETDNIGGRIYGTEWILRFYEREREIREQFLKGEWETDFSVRERDRISLLYEGEAWQNILPQEVVENTSVYMYFLLIWLCVSVCLFVTPLQVKDRMSRMRNFQYSSRRGRKTFWVQFKAAMLSAFALTVVNLAVFMGIFAANKTTVFWECRMYSFAATGFSWVNWKYGTWLIVLVLICALIAMGIAAAAFFMAYYSANYISLLLKLIPVIVVLAVLLPAALSQAFYFYNGLYGITKIPYVEALLIGLVFAAGNFLCAGTYRRIKRRDVV